MNDRQDFEREPCERNVTTRRYSHPVYVNIDGLAHILGMPVRQVRDYVRRGLLPKPVKTGRYWTYNAYLAKQWLRRAAERSATQERYL